MFEIKKKSLSPHLLKRIVWASFVFELHYREQENPKLPSTTNMVD